ncbi:hypothetical protein HGH92_21205 [Chitinophaga varians]|uniref:DUF1161 domain-containing protein n=1 Tax=Chitinophaga varians TaxID=2202339 RepID=A0A847RM05_9BACT|nr:hypothetical protein [Chitinophaga varians]NLR66840.1 hypothetical protein [Chitinophaga varians]
MKKVKVLLSAVAVVAIVAGAVASKARVAAKLYVPIATPGLCETTIDHVSTVGTDLSFNDYASTVAGPCEKINVFRAPNN